MEHFNPKVQDVECELGGEWGIQLRLDYGTQNVL